jgi:hypothetical protein
VTVVPNSRSTPQLQDHGDERVAEPCPDVNPLLAEGRSRVSATGDGAVYVIDDLLDLVCGFEPIEGGRLDADHWPVVPVEIAHGVPPDYDS